MTDKKPNTPDQLQAPFRSAFAAEKAFYLAFVRRDIQLMRQVWSPALTESYCLHPGDRPLYGYQTIIQSWEHIFANQQLSKLQIEHKNLVSNPGIAVHRITEHLTMDLEQGKQQGTFHTLNVLQCVNDCWYMLSHHAAPAPAVEKPSGVTVH